MKPVVSIVIPMYNAAQYIGCALDAAVRQTYTEIEVIVVDDGSTDDSAKIVQANRDPRVRYIHQDNKGQSAAINFGVEQSTGSFIKILDADDWINPTHIESQVNSLNGLTDHVASCRWGYFVDDFEQPAVNHEFTANDYEDSVQRFIDSLTKDEGMMGGWMWLIPRKVWNKCGGYDDTLTLYNDVNFSARLMLAAAGVRFAPEAVYSYRRGVSTSMSVDRSTRTMESVFRALDSAATAMLAERDTPAVRRVFADRLQHWLYQFYPQFPDLAERSERRILELGGSDVEMGGGKFRALLTPIIGWKGVRQLQSVLYRIGWRRVLEFKAKKRLSRFQ